MYRIYYCSISAHRVTQTDEGYKLEKATCSACRRIAGLSGESPAHVSNQNCQFSEAERRDLAIPFGERAKGFRNAKDVDARVEAFKAKNPMLQEGYASRSIVGAARNRGRNS